MTSPGARLRAAWADRPIMIPGAFNALTARLAERLGFAAVYLSGGALSAGWAALPDIGLLTQTEFAEQAAVLARATTLPLLCDADTGFGEAIHVERTVRLFEEAGAAGLHLEDQVMPKRCGHLTGKSLIEPAAMANRENIRGKDSAPTCEHINIRYIVRARDFLGVRQVYSSRSAPPASTALGKARGTGSVFNRSMRPDQPREP